MISTLILLFFLRVNTFLLSLGTLTLHIVNIILLSQENDTGNWWPSYVPYTLYYVGPIVSVLSIVILLILSCVQTRSLINDRIFSVINLLLFIAIIVYNSLEVGTVPWTGEKPDKQIDATNTKGWASYCSTYTEQGIMIRCWTQNGTWLGMLAIGGMWLVLALYTIITRNKDVYRDDYDDYDYDYKGDVPMVAHQREILSSRMNKQQICKSYFEPPIASVLSDAISPTQQQDAYYHRARPQHYDANLNPEYYSNNPNQEDYENSQNIAANNVEAEETYEESPIKTTSKTLVEGGGDAKLDITTTTKYSPSAAAANAESTQPPHSYHDS